MKSILLLEDEEVLGSIYQKKLIASGFCVLWAKNAQEISEILQTTEDIDIAILDQSLHGETTTGIDIIPLVKEKFPQARLFMLSNYSSLDLEKRARQAGADDFLIKIDTSPTLLAQMLIELTS